MNDINKKQNQTQDEMGEYIKTGATIFTTLSLIKSFVFLVFVTIIGAFVMHEAPSPEVKIITVLFLLFCFIAIIIRIISLKKISSFNLNNLNSPPVGLKVKEINFYPEEKIVQIFAGIMKVVRFMPYSAGANIFGVGRIKNPENAIIATDKHILFLYIPLAGADKIFCTDIMNYAIGEDNIKKKLNGMLSSMTLKEIYESYPGNFGFELADIDEVKFNDFLRWITFSVKDGKIYKYGLRTSENLNLAKQIFVNNFS